MSNFPQPGHLNCILPGTFVILVLQEVHNNSFFTIKTISFANVYKAFEF